MNLEDKVKQAIDAGVPLQRIVTVLEKHYKKSPNANLGKIIEDARSGWKSGVQKGFDPRYQAAQRQREALARSAGNRAAMAGVNAGLSSLGKGQDAMASQLAGAGLRTTSTGAWTPQGYRPATFAQNAKGQTNFSGQTDALGQGLQESANVLRQGASDVAAVKDPTLDQKIPGGDTATKLKNLEFLKNSGKINQQEYDAMRAKLTGSEDPSKKEAGKQDAIALISEAAGLIQQASTAGDILNGFIITSDEQKGTGFFSTIKQYAGKAVDTATGVINSTSKLRDELRANYANEKYPESFAAYAQLEIVAKNMALPMIKSGILGRISEGDVKFAQQTAFDITRSSKTWAQQLNAALERLGEPGNIPAVKEDNIAGAKRIEDHLPAEITDSSLAEEENAIANPAKPSITDNISNKVKDAISGWSFSK